MSKKIKFKSAEEKQRYEENQRQWELLQAKYASSKPLRNVKVKSPVVNSLVIRETHSDKIKSFSTPGGSTALKESKVYSGDKLIGIGTLHKSNCIPVFRQDDAKDLSSMRR